MKIGLEVPCNRCCRVRKIEIKPIQQIMEKKVSKVVVGSDELSNINV